MFIKQLPSPDLFADKSFQPIKELIIQKRSAADTHLIVYLTEESNQSIARIFLRAMKKDGSWVDEYSENLRERITEISKQYPMTKIPNYRQTVLRKIILIIAQRLLDLLIQLPDDLVENCLSFLPRNTRADVKIILPIVLPIDRQIIEVNLNNLSLKTLGYKNIEHAIAWFFKEIDNREDKKDSILTHINLRCYKTEITDQHIQTITALAPGLIEINVSWCKNLTNRTLSYMKKLHLETLDISGCHQVSDEGISQLTQPLKKLNLNSCRFITDASLKHLISANMPLIMLLLKGCRKITQEGVDQLAKLPLEQLNVEQCKKVKKNFTTQ